MEKPQTALLGNETIYLRAPEPEDLDLFYQWENDTSLWRYGSTISPFSRFLLRTYIAEAGGDFYQSRQLRLMVVRREGNCVVGMVDLFDFDPFHRRAAVGILIASGYQGSGLAAQALSLIEEYAFGFLGVHMLYAHVPNINVRSMKLFIKGGFSAAGVLQDWIRIGRRYEAVTLLQKISEH